MPDIEAPVSVKVLSTKSCAEPEWLSVLTCEYADKPVVPELNNLDKLTKERFRSIPSASPTRIVKLVHTAEEKRPVLKELMFICNPD